MVCVHCGSETQVINSRLQKRSNSVWRRRKCVQCTSIFTTTEAADYRALWRVKGSSKQLQPFSRDKLFLSLHQSLRHRPSALSDASSLATTIITKLQPLAPEGLMDTKTITQVASVALNRFDSAASVHYQAFHRS